MMCLFVCDLHMFACTLVHIYGAKEPYKGHVLLGVKQSKIKIGNGFLDNRTNAEQFATLDRGFGC